MAEEKKPSRRIGFQQLSKICIKQLVNFEHTFLVIIICFLLLKKDVKKIIICNVSMVNLLNIKMTSFKIASKTS